jgi:hypothetical protein
LTIFFDALLTQYCSGDKTEKNEVGGQVARMGRVQVHTGLWWGKLTERDHLEDQDVDEWIILRRIFTKRDMRA